MSRYEQDARSGSHNYRLLFRGGDSSLNLPLPCMVSRGRLDLAEVVWDRALREETVSGCADVEDD